MQEILCNRNVRIRCVGCRLPIHLCLCEEIPQFKIATRIVVVLQRKEFKVVSNTGFLIPKIFPHAVIRFRGHENKEPLSINDMISPSTYVLYPSKNSTELSPDFIKNCSQPLTLIVPDGNWGQAAKMIRRVSQLKDTPHVKLPLGDPSQYQLRRHQRPNCVCTFEALSRALGIIEGASIQETMDQFFYKWVHHWLYVRGKMNKKEFENYPF